MLRRKKIFGIFLIVWAISTMLSSHVGASARNMSPVDDGTYRESIVTSFEDCMALCRADSGTCRGAVAEQPDVTKPQMVCRLNNGLGAKPLFPSAPPTPLDVRLATAELNAYRRLHGRGPVVFNDKLTQASRTHAKDLARRGTISHMSLDGSGHGERIQKQGYAFRIAAENVATGQQSWAKVFQAWKDSPGHNETLLRNDVTDFGIALVYEPKTTYQTYWAMVVAAPLKGGSRYSRSFPAPAEPTGKTH